MSFRATSKKRRDVAKNKLKVFGDHDKFLSRIKKTLYYGKLPLTERFSLPVSELAAELFTEVKQGHSIQRLDLEEAAGISRKACVSPCSLVLALLYLERLKTCNSDYIQRVAPSELFVISMMIASKFLNDDGEEDEVFNDEWATSAGLDVKEMNQIERDFLDAIGWEVYVSEKAFWSRLSGLEKDIALREGKRRGWFSYTDMDHLMEHMDFTSVAQALISVSAVCLTSYTASILTLIGSAFIVSNIPGTSLSSSSSVTKLSVASSPDLPLDMVSLHSSPQVLSPVDFLATSILFGSINSLNQTSFPESAFQELLTCGKDLSKNATEVTESYWAPQYLTWQWWKSEAKHLFSFRTEVNKSGWKENEMNGISRDAVIDLFASEFGKSEFEVGNNDSMPNNAEGSFEWLSVVKSWFHETMLGKSHQSMFFPIEIAASC